MILAHEDSCYSCLISSASMSCPGAFCVRHLSVAQVISSITFSGISNFSRLTESLRGAVQVSSREPVMNKSCVVSVAVIWLAAYPFLIFSICFTLVTATAGATLCNPSANNKKDRRFHSLKIFFIRKSILWYPSQSVPLPVRHDSFTSLSVFAFIFQDLGFKSFVASLFQVSRECCTNLSRFARLE